jgi:hypothetical protein
MRGVQVERVQGLSNLYAAWRRYTRRTRFSILIKFDGRDFFRSSALGGCSAAGFPAIAHPKSGLFVQGSLP